MCRGVPIFRYLLFFHAFLVASIQPANNESVRDGEVRVDSLETCASISCNNGEHCVKRKFWCKYPPCPTMLYCSKTQRESWKGPITCDSVRCSKGYICLVKVRRCHWDQKCRQQIARCVSEREYYDSPASCAGLQCQTGHRCILRESPCSNPPCKLIKDCAKTEDVTIWHNECRNLGCLSEYECFLRRSLSNCSSLQPCKHTSDCTVTNANRVPTNPNCRGWVCPKNQECSTLQIPESCDVRQGSESCKIIRTCSGLFDATLASSTRSIPRMFITAINIQNGSSQMKTSEVGKEIKERTKIDWQKISTTTDNIDLSLLETIEPFEKSDTISTVEYTGQLEPILDAKHAPTPSRRDLNCNQNESLLFRGNWAAQIEPLKLQRASIYQTPVYVRSTVKNNITESVEPSCEDQRIDPSITEWLNHLRLKTGVDAVNVWAKHAEKNEEHGQFNEWLESVKSTLGASQFQIWLTEFRKLISGRPAFQDWLSTVEGITPSAKHEEKNEYEATESFSNYYSTLVADYDESSTLRPPIRNESKSNSFMGADDDSLIVSVTQRSSNHPSERKNAGHPRINYGLNPRNAYQQKHRGYIEPDRNLRPVEWKNESSTKFSANNSTQHELTQKEETHTTITKPGHLIDILKPQNTIERNSSQDYSTDFLMQQEKKNLDSDTRLNYNPTNHSLLLYKTKENVEKFISTPVKENRQLVATKSTLVSPVDLLARSEENTENNTKQDYQVDSLEQNAVRDSQLKNLPSDKKHGVQDSLTRDNEAHIPIHGLVNISPESINGTMLHDISMNNMGTEKAENLSEKQNLFAPVADGLRVTAPLNALRTLEPPKKTYYALLRFPQEQVDDQLEIIGYPLILSRTSSIDPSNIFSHTPNLPQNSKPRIRQSKTNSSESWKQILKPQQIFRTVFPQISDSRLFEEKGEQIDSQNQKSSSEEKLVQHEPVTFGNSSKFLPLQDERTAQKQHEQNLSPYEEIVPNNQPHQREQLPVISLKSLSASLDSQNPNSRKAYWVLQDPKKPLQNHGDEAIRVKQIPTEQKQKASLAPAISDDYPNRRFQQLSSAVQNIDPTSSSFKYLYQREGVTPYQPAVINRYSSFDSTSFENTPSPLNSPNERIGNLEGGFEEYHSDLNLREYLDTYLDAFVKDAVLKLLIGESLQENEPPIGGMKLESPDPFSQNVYDTIIEAIDDKRHNKFPQRRTKNPFSHENDGDDFNIPHSVEAVQQINDILTGELQQATVTPILNPSMSPIVMEIDYQLYDCEEDEKLQRSPTAGIDKSSATEDEYDSSSRSYDVDEYYYEDEMQ